MRAKRFVFTVSLLLLFLLLAAAAADGIWYCPQCGRQNDGTFCPVDGTRKPDGLGGGTSQSGWTRNAVDLISLNPYYISSGVEASMKPIRDTLGNRYGSYIRGDNSPDEAKRYNSDCCAIWDIGRRYSTLEATCIVREKDKGSKYQGSFKIYGDGRVLYQRSGISSMDKPFTFTVDVRGVTDLKIEMYGAGNMGTSGINAVLADPVLR